MEKRMPNPEKSYALAACGITLLAAGLIFLPGWIGMDGMNGGYALSFVSLWIAISAAVITLFFWRRAAALDRLLQGQQVLAHWTYSPAEWQAYAGAELNEQIRENWALWLLMAGMCLFLGVFFWILDREAGLFVLAVMVGLTLVLAAAAFGMPRLRRRRRDGRTGEAWIGPRGVFFDGVFTPFDSWLSELQKVDWQPASGNRIACLRFHMIYLTRTAIQAQILRVPVPFGRIEEARAILESFEPQSRQPAKRREV